MSETPPPPPPPQEPSLRFIIEIAQGTIILWGNGGPVPKAMTLDEAYALGTRLRLAAERGRARQKKLA